MREPEGFDDDATGTAFRDVILLALCGFVAIVVLLLPHLNPTGEAREADVDAPGNVIVEAYWGDGLDIDVDLWVEAPGDIPVGYSNKGGVVFNLLRDDLGSRADATPFNHEVSYSRGVPAGEYTVNLHLFRNSERSYPVHVTVIASLKMKERSGARQLLTTEVLLTRENEEITAFRFSLDDNARLVPDSVHNIQRDLRVARGKNE